MSERPWFCLRAKPNQEPIAVSELRNQGFPALLPLLANYHGIRPLFPGYLFAQPLEDGRWAPMRYTRGVADILSNTPSRPSPVPPQAMALVLSRLSADGIIWPEPTREVRVGDRIRLDPDHPFAAFELACTRTARDRVFALLTIMGRQEEISFPRSAARAA